MGTEAIALKIDGLACGGGGALTIEKVLARMPGVRSVYVNPATECAYIEIDTQVISQTDIIAEIKHLGYSARRAVEC